jgi:hypothetical protein
VCDSFLVEKTTYIFLASEKRESHECWMDGSQSVGQAESTEQETNPTNPVHPVKKTFRSFRVFRMLRIEVIDKPAASRSEIS